MLQDRSVKSGSPDAGGEVEIVSCENERERLELLRPRPLSIDLNPMEMGRRAVRRLLIRLQHPDIDINIIIDSAFLDIDNSTIAGFAVDHGGVGR